MDTALSILFVEDSESDVLLVIRELRRENYAPDFERVETPEGLRAALAEQSWDLVITDHGMPSFDSLAVISILREVASDTPVIVVSGIIPEDTAIEVMKRGAHDYIMKDNLARLIPAIERELDEAKSRLAHKRAENAIYHMRHHDALTNLYNRVEFEYRLQKALEDSWECGTTHAVLYLDLDQFKIINDTCGHVAGDAMLRQLSVELKKQVRDTDTLARFGGDEFGVLLENCQPEDAWQIAENILIGVKGFVFEWRNTRHKISTSIGFTEVNATDKDIESILSAVDVACYAAKDLGRNRIEVYQKQDNDITKRHGEMHWVTRINSALAEDKFLLYKQDVVPIGNSKSGMERWEFLLRLENDDGSILSPNEFLPAAERYNLMPEIDRWVVKTAFSNLYELFSHRRMLVDPGMFFINISGASLSDGSFYNFVKEQLRYYQIPPQMICFEITETAAVSCFSEAAKFIRKIRQGGCRIALDDFGSGLNTFSYLKAIPVDYIKIDGGFVANMMNDPVDCAIVESINHVANVAGIKTIAEIVENSTAIKRLEEIGVDYVQGYSVSAPEPVEDEFVSTDTA